jgi:copper(I)-binding protein
MAEKNWDARDILSLGPKFRIDINNPSMGSDGNDVYNMYAVTDSKEVSLTGLTEGGTYRIYNDGVTEIVAGYKNQGSVDIVITGKNGDICITAEKNGRVRIRGKNIMIQADEDVDIKAGRNITLKSGSGRILLDGNKIDRNALTGNMVENTWAHNVFNGSQVGGDVVKAAFDIAKPFITGK